MAFFTPAAISQKHTKKHYFLIRFTNRLRTNYERAKMATIRKVTTAAGPRYRIQIAIAGHPRESATRTTKVDAMAYAAARETEIRRGLATGIQVGRTVDEAFRRYELDVSSHKRGKRWEAIRLNAIGRMKIDGIAISEMKLGDVTSDFLGKLRDQRMRVDKVTGSTVNRELNLLSHVFSTAVTEWKWLAKSPTTDVRRPKSEASRDRLPTDDEIERICYALGFDLGGAETVTTKSQAVAAMLLFAIETAVRSGEACALMPQWVRDNVIHIPAAVAKNQTKRDVPLSKRAVELLGLLPAPAVAGTMFGVSDSSRDALFRKAMKKALVTGLTFHDSRHLAITRLSKKLGILALARMVGHRDLRQLQIYYNEPASDIATRLD